MRSELKIPPKCPMVRVERYHTIRIEIVTLARVTLKIWTRIAGRPKDQIRLRIKRACEPCRAASRFIGITIPSFCTGLTRLWNGIEFPDLPTGPGISSVNKTANTKLPSCHTRDHRVFQC